MKKIFTILAVAAIAFLTTSSNAQVVNPIDDNKLANGGYDLVAYFTDNAAVKGNTEFTTEINGVKYQFATEAHKKLFKANPTKYLPVCDGFCAWGVAEKGKKVPVNPQTFKIINKKLYLFFNGDFNGTPFNTLTEWNKNEGTLLTQLPTKWAAIKK